MLSIFLVIYYFLQIYLGMHFKLVKVIYSISFFYKSSIGVVLQ